MVDHSTVRFALAIRVLKHVFVCQCFERGVFCRHTIVVNIGLVIYVFKYGFDVFSVRFSLACVLFGVI